ncbi:MAG: uroporphyrinogen-III C-methyltransferase [Dorea sp.]|jgi:uroporphyrinogen III methyltransferase/synthase|nr:uroporphyrinogen-III C-methyltransferase [Dorea sp.]
MTGKVWLVGAGPGDLGLMTVKGKILLKEADVIIYDHLVGNEILSSLDDSKKLINVGKLAGHHPIPQEKINQILVEEAKKGQKVVRLKGGDPFLFGRGGEELVELKRCNVPFEVVPGVTSSLAVPAYNGIPVTHRDIASSVHIITGHKKQEQEDDMDYEALVRTGGTLVFLMGVAALPDIRKKLLKSGMSPDLPAAILQEGTTAGQKRVSATLGDLEEKAKEAKISPPAIIIVGKVCGLSDILSWREELPLFGMRIVLTRPRALISSLAERLRFLGAEVLELPAIDTVPAEKNERLPQCFMQIGTYDWIVFTSQTGVHIFFEQAKREKFDIRKLSGVKFAVIGEGTKAALSERGIYAELIPEVFDGESLGHALADQEIRGRHILIPRAEKGNELLVPILEEAGALVEEIAVYRTVYHAGKAVSVKEEMEKGKIDIVVFTSSSTVEGFSAATKGMDHSKIRAACIGRQTAETAARYNMKCFTAPKATLDALTELILDMRS